MKPLSIILVCILFLLIPSSAKPLHEADLKNSWVDVPWTEFKEIIDKLTRTHPAAMNDTVYPPVDYCISSAHIKGTVADRKTARFTVVVTVHITESATLKQNGWVVVPVGADNSDNDQYAILESTALNGKPVPVYNQDANNHILISKPGVYTVTLNYFCPIISEEGNWKMALCLPNAASALLDFFIPESRAEVWVNGIQRASQPANRGTRLETPVSLDQELNIRYSFVGESVAEGGDAMGMAPKVFASTGMLVTIKENRISYQYRVDYQIWHQKRTFFSIALPDSLPVENVLGAGLTEWKVAQTDSGAVLVARTGFAPDQSYTLTLNFSKKLETVEATIPVPVLRVLDVNRESGYIAVQATETMEVFTGDTVRNLTVAGPQELPDWLQSQQEVIMRFKYSTPPCFLSLKVLRHKDMPVLVAIADEALFTGLVTRDGYTLVKFRYSIRNNHKQYLSLTMPQGWTLWSALIDGNAVMPASSESPTVALIPLKKMSKTDEGTGFILELVYWHEGKKLGGSGTMRFETPIVDINCQKINGELWLPPQWDYSGFKGSLEKVDDYKPRYIASSISRAEPRQKMSAQSNTMAVGKKGDVFSLPVEIEVPNKGGILRFSKNLTIAGEKGGLSLKYYKKLLSLWKVKAFCVWLCTLLVAFYAARWAFRNRKKRTIWPMVCAGCSALLLILIMNSVLSLQAGSLIRTMLFGVACAWLSHRGSIARKEATA